MKVSKSYVFPINLDGTKSPSCSFITFSVLLLSEPSLLKFHTKKNYLLISLPHKMDAKIKYWNNCLYISDNPLLPVSSNRRIIKNHLLMVIFIKYRHPVLYASDTNKARRFLQTGIFQTPNHINELTR